MSSAQGHSASQARDDASTNQSAPDTVHQNPPLEQAGTANATNVFNRGLFFKHKPPTTVLSTIEVVDETTVDPVEYATEIAERQEEHIRIEAAKSYYTDLQDVVDAVTGEPLNVATQLVVLRSAGNGKDKSYNIRNTVGVSYPGIVCKLHIDGTSLPTTQANPEEEHATRFNGIHVRLHANKIDVAPALRLKFKYYQINEMLASCAVDFSFQQFASP